MLVCVFFARFCTRDRGCSAHPAFPAPSCSLGGGNRTQTSGATRREIADVHLLFEIRMNYRLISDDGPYSGAAFSPRTLVSFAANDATVMSTAIKAITKVQMAFI